MPAPAHIRADFERQAVGCEWLGSPFTARLCRLLGERLTDASSFGARVYGWSGNPKDDVLPLRVAGAFHALKRGGHAGLAKVYPPHDVDDETLWLAIEGTIAAHDDFLTRFLDSAPQTNEVLRSSAILGLALHVAERTSLPIALYEVGASAGLNLSFDTYDYQLGAHRWGNAASPVKITADWQGTPPPLDAPLSVTFRAGADLNPLDPSDEALRERLLAYIWPDQTARLARIEAALRETAERRIRVERADAADWVERMFAAPGRAKETRLLLHTIAWQYFPEATKARIERAMQRAGEMATPEAPLAWASVEQDEKDITSAVIRLRLWPGGTDEELGRADFHGRWARWG